MATAITWNGSNYSIPAAGELNWSSLSAFLVDLGNNAGIDEESKQAIRVALTTPISASASTDYALISDLTAPGAVAVTLPVGEDGQIFVIVDGKGDALTNNITLTPDGTETIAGAATLVLDKNRESVMIQYEATTSDWKILFLNRYPDDINLTSEVTGVLPIASGGTASSAALSGNRAVVTDGTSIIEATTTDTEIGYVNGVTSSIQTQLDARVFDTGDTMTGDLVMDNQKGVQFREPTGAGTEYVYVKAPATLGANVDFVLPNSNGSVGQALTTDGAGVTSWASVGGGGGGFLFNEPAGESPTRSELAGERSYDYEAGITQKLIGWARVPSTYSAGNQVNMSIAFAVTSAGTDDVRMEAIATLIKAGTAITATTNQHTSTNADVTLSGTSNALNSQVLDLSSSIGEINAVAVAAGDLIKIELYREAPAGTEDANDIHFIPSATEVTFS